MTELIETVGIRTKKTTKTSELVAKVTIKDETQRGQDKGTKNEFLVTALDGVATTRTHYSKRV